MTELRSELLGLIHDTFTDKGLPLLASKLVGAFGTVVEAPVALETWLVRPLNTLFTEKCLATKK